MAEPDGRPGGPPPAGPLPTDAVLDPGRDLRGAAVPRRGGARIAVWGLVAVAVVALGATLGPRAIASLPGSAAAGPDAAAVAVPTDYPPDTQVAVVDGVPITMRELDTAVRVVRALDSLKGQPVPAHGTAEMRAYQQTVLKRLIDRTLVLQAIRHEDVRLPVEIAPIGDHVQSYLGQVGATHVALDSALAANGVARSDLEAWFEASRAINHFFLTRIRTAAEREAGDAVARAWLADAWRGRPITVTFHGYQPAQDSPSEAMQP